MFIVVSAQRAVEPAEVIPYSFYTAEFGSGFTVKQCGVQAMFKHPQLHVNKKVNRNVVKERSRILRYHNLFGCSKCGKTFNRRSTLWNHAKIHSDLRPYGCSVCDRRFKWKNSLLSHAKVHMRRNEISTIESMVDLKKIVRSRGTRNEAFAHDNSFTSTYCTKRKSDEEKRTYDNGNFMASMNVIRAYGYSEYFNREDGRNDRSCSCRSSSSSSSACNSIAPWVPSDFIDNVNVIPAWEYKEFVNNEDFYNDELYGRKACNAVVPGVYMGYGINKLLMQLTHYCLRDITVILPDVSFYQRLWKATFDSDVNDLSYECFVNANDNVLLPVLKRSKRDMTFQSRKEEPIFYFEYLDNCAFDALNTNLCYQEKRWAIYEYHYYGSEVSSAETDSESSAAPYDGISLENELNWKDGDNNVFRYGDGLPLEVSEEKAGHGSILMAKDCNFQLPRTYEFI
ncbi:zf-C2H2 domain containing protein [Trichuris trichiura]|uniref:Zf-C2H2 domain containing protein n=1 Tax=Trichuris trichiura TaxID=36087 RepID=A0A077Z6E8_TRITR|nr:zf-C2H2 domain containing protein [Trichuris trichiura]